MDVPPQREPTLARPADAEGEADQGGDGVTTLLGRLRDGDVGARDALYEQSFERLRICAHRLMAGQDSHTLPPTALVAEAWLRLSKGGSEPEAFEDRTHFFAAVARTMRCVVIDHERQRRAQARQAPGVRVPLEELGAILTRYQERAEDLLALDEALDDLGAADPELVKVVELRFFLGCTTAEIAALVGLSEATVRRRFEEARRRLYERLRPG